jgi:hypothetical protein
MEQLDLFAGLDSLPDGIRRASASTSADWQGRAERAVRWLAAATTDFQAYDVVRRFGLDEPGNPAKQWGALFARLHRACVIEPAGWAQSKRPTAKGSACRTWRGITSGEKETTF